MNDSNSGRRRFAAFAWFVLAYNVGVVLWGAYVRATGSGAGCGGHWPLCNGEILPRTPQTATLIEFTHRITSGLALVLVALLLYFAFRLFPARDVVRRAAGFGALFTMTEALLGAALVLLGYVAKNTSAWRGAVLSVHLVNTLLLLGSFAVVAWLARPRPGRDAGEQPSPAGEWRAFPPRMKLAWRLAVVALLFTGMSGAVAALGDTLFTSTTLAEGVRLDFSAGAHPFVRVRVLHPFLAGGLALCLLMASAATLDFQRASRTATRLATVLLALTFAQVCLGALDILLLAPVGVQLLHLLGADLVAITFVLLTTELLFPARRREVERDREPGPLAATRV